MTPRDATPEWGCATPQANPKDSPASCANGWTGGQYSVFRFTLGVYLLVHLVRLVRLASEMSSDASVLGKASESALHPFFPNLLLFWDSSAGIVALLLVGTGLSVPFALGVCDRLVALILLYLGICLFTTSPLISNPSMPFIGWILLAHAFVPRRPYGSWDARRRVDPGADWRMPARIYTATWIVLAIGYAYSGATKLGSPSWVDGSALFQALSDPLAGRTLLGELVLLLPPPLISLATWSVLALEISFAPLAILRKARPWLWLALLGVQLSLMTMGCFADSSAGMLMLHFFAFDPAWVKGKEGGRTATIFYDGGCGLCHRFVRFALAEDREGKHFRFAPLAGNAFAAVRSESARAETLDQIDSIVLSLSDGNLFVRGAAMLGIGKRLGGLWRAAALAAGVLPLRWLDAGYDGIAKARHRLFAAPPDACPILPPHLRARFDLP
jgi:predicted DCC family thiol-disulfide oxidoreductase YuxK